MSTPRRLRDLYWMSAITFSSTPAVALAFAVSITADDFFLCSFASSLLRSTSWDFPADAADMVLCLRRRLSLLATPFAPRPCLSFDTICTDRIERVQGPPRLAKGLTDQSFRLHTFLFSFGLTLREKANRPMAQSVLDDCRNHAEHTPYRSGPQ